MQNIWGVQWEHPEVLWGLAALPLLVYLCWHDWLLKHRMVRQWSQVADVIGRSALPSLWIEGRRAVCLLSAFTLAVMGFASPTLPRVAWEPAWERVAVGLLLDVSSSMRAPVEQHDAAGVSRLDMLKQAVQELIESLPAGVRVGVIAFAGVAVPVVPEPSTDHQAVIAKVRRLDQEFIVNPGSNLTAAVQQGLTLFVDTTLDVQPDTVSLILLSDGDTAVTQGLKQVLQRVSLPIYTLGIGTPQPVPIPDPQSSTGFMVDQGGRGITTVVNESLLRSIAEQTGGVYYPFLERSELARALQHIVAQQSLRVTQPVPRPRSVRRLFFLAALCCLFLYQLQARNGKARWGKK